MPAGQADANFMESASSINVDTPGSNDSTAPNHFETKNAELQYNATAQTFTSGDNPDEAADTVLANGHLGVPLVEKEIHRPFILTRSPTTRFAESSDIPELTSQFHLNSVPNLLEPDDEVMSRENEPMTPKAVPFHFHTSRVTADPSSPDYLLEVQNQDEVQGLEEELRLMTMGSQPNYSPDQQHLRIARDTIRGSGTGDIPIESLLRPGTSVASEVTDAGDQQFKHQKRAIRSASTPHKRVESISDVVYGSNYPTQDQLLCELFEALQQTREPREKGFLPKAQLDSLVNLQSVKLQLVKSPGNMTGVEIKECAEIICTETEVPSQKGKPKLKSFRMIFALLVLVRMSSSISLFIEEDVSDLDLPLSVVKNKGLYEVRRKNTLKGGANEPLRCFKSWNPMQKDQFNDYQWTMLAPYFDRAKYNKVWHYPLTERHILPFIRTENDGCDDVEYHGGFGRVFMVRIHPENHNFPNPMRCERGFAIKQLLHHDRAAFDREVDILKKFVGENSHDHIVTLLATYEKSNKFHLIFHRAEGNLFDYWKRINPHPEVDYDNVLWMAKQCAGIAHGLLKLHKHNTVVAARDIPNHDVEEEFKRRSTVEKLDRHVYPSNPTNQNQAEIGAKLKLDIEQKAETNPTNQTFAYRNPLNLENQPAVVRQYTDERDAILVHEPLASSEDLVRKWGRHGDLKPENILWYDSTNDEEGTLKISDFGAAELNSRDSRSKPRSHLANTMTYRPPEFDLQPRIIRQSYDIWSLGCVYMEFVTWMLGGVELWVSFSRMRLAPDIFQALMQLDTFFEIVKNDTDVVSVMVKKVVTEFFDTLHSHPNCTNYFHDILDMIKHNMIIVEPETVYKTRRMYCQEVYDRLDTAYKKCRTDKDYATKRTPWSPKKVTAEPLMESVKVSMTDRAKRVISDNISNLRVHWGPIEEAACGTNVTR